MKKLVSVAFYCLLLWTTGCAAHKPLGGVAQTSSSQLVPLTFASVAAAEEYAKGLFAGGRTEVLRVGQGDVLVFWVYGSGWPDLRIAAYLKAKDGWVLEADWKPESVEFHDVFVSGDTVMIRGEQTKKEWVLFRFDGGKD